MQVGSDEWWSNLRHDKAFHIALGDVRVTIGMQEDVTARIVELENALKECKTTSLDMANRTVNIWHLARAICTIVERVNGYTNPADKHD